MITTPKAWKVYLVPILTAFLAVFLLALTARCAMAQQPMCAPHDELLRVAAEKYGEEPAFIGLSAQKRLVEILVSKKGTFTILLIDPARNMACVADFWEGWQGVVAHRKGSY